MTIAVSITETNVFTALRSFLLSVLPAGMDVIRAQVNRVPEPSGPDFVLMNSTMRLRLATNIDSYADALFRGVIQGSTMIVTEAMYGALQVGSYLFMENLPSGTTVSAFLNGATGGVGAYTITPAFPGVNLTDQFGNQLTDQAGNYIIEDTLPLGAEFSMLTDQLGNPLTDQYGNILTSVPVTKISAPIAAGNILFLQKTQFSMQLDVHGPNSGDNAQAITTMLRDDYAVQQFATSGLAITPLYADDPRQIPFINAEQQYENRWVIEAMLQVDPVITIPQQFADQLNVMLINVAATYPA